MFFSSVSPPPGASSVRTRRFTPVFPPTEASTIDSSVVGHWMTGTPRRYDAAAYPATSPTIPPPIARTGSRRSRPAPAIAPSSSPRVSSDFVRSVACTRCVLTLYPAPAKASRTGRTNASGTPSSIAANRRPGAAPSTDAASRANPAATPAPTRTG
jgi:hypothetical protein